MSNSGNQTVNINAAMKDIAERMRKNIESLKNTSDDCESDVWGYFEEGAGLSCDQDENVDAVMKNIDNYMKMLTRSLMKDSRKF